MIFILVATFALATFVSWMLIKTVFLRRLLGIVFSLLLFGSILLMILNMNEHFGMAKVVSTQKERIYSVAGNKLSTGILATTSNKKLGSDLTIYLYKNKENESKIKTAVPSSRTSLSMKEISGSKAYRVTKVTKWKYKNALSKLFFGFGNLDKVVSKKQIVFQIPDNEWLQLTKQQLSKLQKLIANPKKIKNERVLTLLATAQEAQEAGQDKKAARVQATAIRILLSISLTKADKDLTAKIESSSKSASKKESEALSSAALASQQAAESASESASISQSEAEQSSASASASAAAKSSSAASSSSSSSSSASSSSSNNSSSASSKQSSSSSSK